MENHPHTHHDENQTAETKAGKLGKFFVSNNFKWIIAALAGLVLLIGVFALGLKLGEHKERFTESWASNYPQNFLGRRGFPMMPGGMMFNAHGVLGTILSKDNAGLTIKDDDGDEKNVVIATSTAIRLNNQSISADSLKANDQVVVFGSPNANGQIDAKLIRVLNQQ